MKRISTLLCSLLLALAGANAQVNDEITVHDDRIDSDEVMTLPEGMSASADSLLQIWHAKHYLFPDTTCANPDYNPPFSPEVFKERLSRIPAVMEMPYNSVVQKFIDQYSNRLRRSVSYMLGAGNFYIPIFEEALDYYGLPLELKYLPVIESALDPTAKSHAGAVGLWQFMLTTAKRYDLQVNSLVDERRDPIKSTWAAARYLRDLYDIYGDWNLVIAAYNCGPGNINKAIHRAEGAKDYWNIYPYLPKETRGYVPAFIAANYMMNYYCEHNICPMKTKLPVSTDTVMLSRNVHIKQISELCGIEEEAIRALNPQYCTDIIPGASSLSTLRLPQDKILAFIDLKDSIYNHRADDLMTRRIEVKPVETETATKNSKANRKKSQNSRARTVTVRRGDTLGAIAARNKTTVNKLRRLNGIKGDRIKPGQRIRVR